MNNRARLRRAIMVVLASTTKQGIGIISFPEEYYFLERALVELGYLKGNKNKTAYLPFLKLMGELNLEPIVDLPSKKEHALAAKMITGDPFPWKAAGSDKVGYWSSEETELMANEADLPRWRLVYRLLQKHLEG